MLGGRIWTGDGEGKEDGILKDDWWIGFGRWFLGVENKVIYRQNNH
jgi:hypothetical protein